MSTYVKKERAFDRFLEGSAAEADSAAAPLQTRPRCKHSEIGNSCETRTRGGSHARANISCTKASPSQFAELRRNRISEIKSPSESSRGGTRRETALP